MTSAVPRRASRLPSTVGRLLDAAAEAFADSGFHATTTRDIASRAGLSPAGVYVHFATKEAVLLFASARGATSRRWTVRGSATGPGTPTARVARAIVRVRRLARGALRWPRGSCSTSSPTCHPSTATGCWAAQGLDAAVREVLEEGVASGDFDVADLRSTTLALMSLCMDVARWYSPGVRRTPDRIGPTYASLGLRLLGARA